MKKAGEKRARSGNVATQRNKSLDVIKGEPSHWNTTETLAMFDLMHSYDAEDDKILEEEYNKRRKSLSSITSVTEKSKKQLNAKGRKIKEKFDFFISILQK